MDNIEYAQRCIYEFDEKIKLIKNDQWSNSTPDTDWDVRSLVNHIVYESLWAVELLSGKTIEKVGDKFDGNILKGEPLKVWEEVKTNLLEIIKPEIFNNKIKLSYGEFTALYYILEITSDILIHTWDLAKGIDEEDILPEDLCEYCYELMIPKQKMVKDAGLFKERIDTLETDNFETKLLSLTGRKRFS